jgi:hypothetical protein
VGLANANCEEASKALPDAASVANAVDDLSCLSGDEECDGSVVAGNKESDHLFASPLAQEASVKGRPPLHPRSSDSLRDCFFKSLISLSQPESLQVENEKLDSVAVYCETVPLREQSVVEYNLSLEASSNPNPKLIGDSSSKKLIRTPIEERDYCKDVYTKVLLANFIPPSSKLYFDLLLTRLLDNFLLREQEIEIFKKINHISESEKKFDDVSTADTLFTKQELIHSSKTIISNSSNDSRKTIDNKNLDGKVFDLDIEMFDNIKQQPKKKRGTGEVASEAEMLVRHIYEKMKPIEEVAASILLIPKIRNPIKSLEESNKGLFQIEHMDSQNDSQNENLFLDSESKFQSSSSKFIARKKVDYHKLSFRKMIWCRAANSINGEEEEDGGAGSSKERCELDRVKFSALSLGQKILVRDYQDLANVDIWEALL